MRRRGKPRGVSVKEGLKEEAAGGKRVKIINVFCVAPLKALSFCVFIVQLLQSHLTDLRSRRRRERVGGFTDSYHQGSVEAE